MTVIICRYCNQIYTCIQIISQPNFHPWFDLVVHPKAAWQITQRSNSWNLCKIFGRTLDFSSLLNASDIRESSPFKEVPVVSIAEMTIISRLHSSKKLTALIENTKNTMTSNDIFSFVCKHSDFDPWTNFQHRSATRMPAQTYGIDLRMVPIGSPCSE